MLDLSFAEYLSVFSLICFAGFVDAIAGGGGLITVPTYMAFGLPDSLILGTNKFASSLGTCSAVFRFIKSGRIHWPIILPASFAAFCAAIGGALLSSYLSSKAMVYLLLILIPAILFTQRRGFAQKIDPSTLPLPAIGMAGVIGAVMGAYDGFFGPGTGTFLLLCLNSFLAMNLIDASANARVINFSSNLSAFFIFLFKGQILWHLGLIAAAAAIIGNWLGSGFALKGGEKQIRIAFYFVLLMLLVKCVSIL